MRSDRRAIPLLTCLRCRSSTLDRKASASGANARGSCLSIGFDIVVISSSVRSAKKRFLYLCGGAPPAETAGVGPVAEAAQYGLIEIGERRQIETRAQLRQRRREHVLDQQVRRDLEQPIESLLHGNRQGGQEHRPQQTLDHVRRDEARGGERAAKTGHEFLEDLADARR